jgi:hypothetical protein
VFVAESCADGQPLDERRHLLEDPLRNLLQLANSFWVVLDH